MALVVLTLEKLPKCFWMAAMVIGIVDIVS
jgi:hypothetical protein